MNARWIEFKIDFTAIFMTFICGGHNRNVLNIHFCVFSSTCPKRLVNVSDILSPETGANQGVRGRWMFQWDWCLCCWFVWFLVWMKFPWIQPGGSGPPHNPGDQPSLLKGHFSEMFSHLTSLSFKILVDDSVAKTFWCNNVFLEVTCWFESFLILKLYS